MQRRPGSSGRQKKVTTGGSNVFRRGEGLSKGDRKRPSATSSGTGTLLRNLFLPRDK